MSILSFPLFRRFSRKSSRKEDVVGSSRSLQSKGLQASPTSSSDSMGSSRLSGLLIDAGKVGMSISMPAPPRPQQASIIKVNNNQGRPAACGPTQADNVRSDGLDVRLPTNSESNGQTSQENRTPSRKLKKRPTLLKKASSCFQRNTQLSIATISQDIEIRLENTATNLKPSTSHPVSEINSISWRTWGRQRSNKRHEGGQSPPSAWLAHQDTTSPPQQIAALGLCYDLTTVSAKTVHVPSEDAQPTQVPKTTSRNTATLINSAPADAIDLGNRLSACNDSHEPNRHHYKDDLQSYLILRPVSPCLELETEFNVRDENLAADMVTSSKPTITKPTIATYSSVQYEASARGSVYHDLDCYRTPPLSARPSSANLLGSPDGFTPYPLTPVSGFMTLTLPDVTQDHRADKLDGALLASDFDIDGLSRKISYKRKSMNFNTDRSEYKRKNRQSLMQIDDDAAFAKVATELLQADREVRFGDEKEAIQEWTALTAKGTDHSNIARQGKDMRAFFLVRELLNGEKSYRRQLVRGIEMLMEDAVRVQSLKPLVTEDSRTTASLKPQKLQKKSFSFVNLPTDYFSPSTSSSGAEKTNDNTWLLPRSSSFLVARSSSDRLQHRSRTYSELAAVLDDEDQTQDDRICGLLLEQLRELCTVSRRLAYALEFDPSPAEAATSFLKHKDDLLKVYTEWARIIGEVMMSGVPTRIPAHASRKSINTGTWQRKPPQRRHSTRDPTSASTDTGEMILADIVIKPTARAGQYVLLLQELRDCLPVDHQDATSIREALAAAKRIASECDQCQVTDLRPNN